MAEKITGSLDAFSALELASMTEKLDMAGKQLLKQKEVTQMIGLGQSILEEGILTGRAEDILDLLADIGGASPELAKQIRGQEDEQVLRRWLKLAARADHVEQFVEAM